MFFSYITQGGIYPLGYLSYQMFSGARAFSLLCSLLSTGAFTDPASNVCFFNSITSISGLIYIFFIIFIRLEFYILLLTSCILLHDDLLAIHNVQTLNRLSYALTIQVVDFTFDISYLAADIVYVRCFIIEVNV